MKSAKTILCMISITLILVLSCGEDEKPSQPVSGKFTIDNFQNAVGTHWRYSIEHSPGGFKSWMSVFIQDTITLFGSESATTWIFEDSDFIADIQHVSIVDDSVRYYCYDCSVPYRILMFPLEIGKSWQADVAEGTAFCKVQTIVDISVPAGEFKTYRVYIDRPPSEMFPDTNEKTTLWIAPEDGMVKMERVTESEHKIWELVLYQSPE